MTRMVAKKRPPARAQIDGTPNDLVQRIGELRQIPVDAIDLPKNPARRVLGDIAALAESMQDYGLQQPISVRVDGDRYSLTSGMRRVAAARLLGWPSIVGFVRTLNADDAYVVDLVENLQREDLSAEEEADALGELVRTRGWTLQQVADALKRSVAYVSKRVRVFEDPRLREAVTSQNLPISTAEELLASEGEQRLQLIERALTERWDQVQARAAVRASELEPPQRAGAPRATGAGDSTAAPSRGAASAQAEARPRGFTRAVRDFHRLIITIRAQDLTTADRSALRSLFRDLVLLGRAPAVPRKPMFPELPSATEPGRLRSARSRSAAKRNNGSLKASRTART